MHAALKITCAAAAIVFCLWHVAIEAQAECSKLITPHEALNIANRAVQKAGFDLSDLEATVSRDIQEWTEDVRMHIRGNAGEKAKQEAERIDSVLRSYTNFFSISYSPKPHPQGHTRLGGGSVLLDADTGSILIIQPAHLKAIYPKATPKKNKKQREPCP